VGATLDETRVELEAQRARVRGTAERLESATRRSLDLRALIGRHPGRTIGLAAGAAFFLLGGPHRTVKAVRRALGGAPDGARAYAALPPTLRAFVDDLAPGFGESKAEAKGQLALALHAWRENPKNRKKADRLVSETLTPPGPERAFWALVEVVGVTAAGIIAKQIVARRLAGGMASGLFGQPKAPEARADSKPATEASKPTGPAKAPTGKAATATKPKAGASTTGYSGWSGREASVAGPAREPSPPKTATPSGPTKPAA
jgi:hypothetical protein